MWNQHLSHLIFGGAFSVWHTSNRMLAVHCELLCLTPLFLRSSLFSFVVCPFFRHPCTSLLLTRLLRDLQGNLFLFSSPHHSSFLSTILLTAVAYVVIQHRVKAAFPGPSSGVKATVAASGVFCKDYYYSLFAFVI